MASQHSAPARVSASRLAPPVARALASASRRLAAVICRPTAAESRRPVAPAASAAATRQLTAAFTSRQPAATATRCLLAAALALAGLVLVAAPPALADEEKVETPTVTLQVGETEATGATGSYYDAADAFVGEAVPYRATGTLPYDIASFGSYYYSFTIDIADALVLDESSITVTHVTGSSTTSSSASSTRLATLASAEGTDLTSAFTTSYSNHVLTVTCTDLLAAASVSASDTIVVDYEATLDAASAATGTAGVAQSFASITYTASTESTATGTTVEDEADLYTWQLVIGKLAAGTGDALAGATFTVQAEDGRYVTADGTLSAEAAELVTDEDGLITLAGVDAGTYTVTETAAPSGYAAVDAFTATITSNATSGTPVLAVSVSTDEVAITEVGTESGTVALAVTDPLSTTATITETVSKLTGGSGDSDDDDAADSGDDASSDDADADASSSGSSKVRTGDVVRGLLLAAAIAAIAAAAAWALQRRRKQGGAQ